MAEGRAAEGGAAEGRAAEGSVAEGAAWRSDGSGGVGGMWLHDRAWLPLTSPTRPPSG